MPDLSQAVPPPPPPAPPPYLAAMLLRGNPFSPELNIGGRQIRFDYLQGPLTPQQQMPAGYYFDHYAWRDRADIGQIGVDGRIQQFPDRFDRPGMIVLISGTSQTGRSSLENLLVHEVELRAGTKPVHTEFKIEIVSNKIQAAQNFALRFASDVEDYLTDLQRAKEAKALSKKLRDTIKDWKENLVEGQDNTEFLFDGLTRVTRKGLPNTPIMFSLDASSHNNTADALQPACAMLRNLADFVLLSLSKYDDAAFLKTRFRDRHIRVAWIDAPQVGASQIKRFLEGRLVTERTAPAAHRLFPFTEDAIDALFAPTPAAKGVIMLSIGMVIRKLKGAFDKKCTELQAILAAPPPGGIAPASLEITAADMRNYLTR